MSNKLNFFIETKMLLACDFYNNFSISALFDPLHVSLAIQVPQVPKNGRCKIPNARKIHLFKITQLVVKSRGTPDHEISVMFMEIERATTSKKKY